MRAPPRRTPVFFLLAFLALGAAAVAVRWGAWGLPPAFVQIDTRPWSAPDLFGSAPLTLPVLARHLLQLAGWWLGAYAWSAWLLLVPALGCLAAALHRGRWLPPSGKTAWVRLGPLLLLAWLVALQALVLHRYPVTADEYAFLFEARILRMGAVAIPSPPDFRHFPMGCIINDGRWYSQWQVGWSAFLALGDVLGMAGWVAPILGTGGVCFLYLLTRRLFGPRAALWGTALWAASAMFWLNSGSYTSHPAALFLALLMLYFHSRTLARPRPGDWVLASLAAAALTLTRQQEVPGPLVGAVALAWAQGRRGWRAFLKAPVLNLAAGVALGLLLTLWVNAHQTGDPFRLAVDVTQHHAGYGFGVQQHDLPRALWNLAFSLARLTLWLPVGFLGLSLWGLGPPNRRALALVLAAGAQILVYMGFFTQGRLEYGARYYFLTAGLLAPLAGRGLARVEAWLARRRGLGPRAVLVPAALLGFSVAMQLALVLRVEAEVRAGLEPLQRIHRFLASRPGPTLVLVRSAPRGEARALIRVGPRLDDRDLFAVYLDPAENQRLVQAHPRRQAFLLDYRQGAFSLTPYRFREPGAEDYLWAGVNYLQSLGQPARAAPMLERAVQLDPAASRAWALLGYCYRYAGDLPSALKAWRRALDLDPRMHQVRFDLAEALWEAGQPRAARQEWEAVAREAADGPLVRQARERLLR